MDPTQVPASSQIKSGAIPPTGPSQTGSIKTGGHNWSPIKKRQKFEKEDVKDSNKLITSIMNQFKLALSFLSKALAGEKKSVSFNKNVQVKELHGFQSDNGVYVRAVRKHTLTVVEENRETQTNVTREEKTTVEGEKLSVVQDITTKGGETISLAAKRKLEGPISKRKETKASVRSQVGLSTGTQAAFGIGGNSDRALIKGAWYQQIADPAVANLRARNEPLTPENLIKEMRKLNKPTTEIFADREELKEALGLIQTQKDDVLTRFVTNWSSDATLAVNFLDTGKVEVISKAISDETLEDTAIAKQFLDTVYPQQHSTEELQNLRGRLSAFNKKHQEAPREIDKFDPELDQELIRLANWMRAEFKPETYNSSGTAWGTQLIHLVNELEQSSHPAMRSQGSKMGAILDERLSFDRRHSKILEDIQ